MKDTFLVIEKNVKKEWTEGKRLGYKYTDRGRETNEQGQGQGKRAKVTDTGTEGQ